MLHSSQRAACDLILFRSFDTETICRKRNVNFDEKEEKRDWYLHPIPLARCWKLLSRQDLWAQSSPGIQIIIFFQNIHSLYFCKGKVFVDRSLITVTLQYTNYIHVVNFHVVHWTRDTFDKSFPSVWFNFRI